MFSTRKTEPSQRQLRSFGLILAAGFLIIGAAPMLRHRSPRLSLLAIGLICGAAGLIAPGVLRYLYPLWMKLADALGWINSRIILGAIYYVVMTPIRLFMSLTGHDPMKRKFDPNLETYRVVRKTRAVSHMKHQF